MSVLGNHNFTYTGQPFVKVLVQRDQNKQPQLEQPTEKQKVILARFPSTVEVQWEKKGPEALCDLCKQGIGLGTSVGLLYAFEQHKGSSICKTQISIAENSEKATSIQEKIQQQQQKFKNWFTVPKQQEQQPQRSPTLPVVNTANLDVPSIQSDGESSILPHNSALSRPSSPISVSSNEPIASESGNTALHPLIINSPPHGTRSPRYFDSFSLDSCSVEDGSQEESISATEINNFPFKSPGPCLDSPASTYLGDSVSPVQRLPCPDIILSWDSGSIFTTYPWQMHSYHPSSLGFYFSGIDEQGNRFWIRSLNCDGEVSGNQACLSCRAIETSQSLRKLRDHAIDISKYSNFKYYNHEQLQAQTRDY
ncbi:hypothetical protein M422DRAFT_260719 [Sphaerobolus stellatus SS14]|uniref:Uncharacterized protein n=1 Tax=Sphaerobolus stellatus (strain SS14) TaxID=990650 RepID=A0A0C9VH18_SPHS4|nr:hypothetical protein M422DRAFT_260719 [Sphaerobolus stellatus SS14]